MDILISDSKIDDEATLEAITKIPISKDEDWADLCSWAISAGKPKVLDHLIKQVDKKAKIDVWNIPYNCAGAIMKFDKNEWDFAYMDVGENLSVLPTCAQAYKNGDTEIMNYYLNIAKGFEEPALKCFSILTGIL